MIWVTSDHWSWSGSSQRNAPQEWPKSSFSSPGYEREQNDHNSENALLSFKILLTDSLRKCMDIGLENLYVDIGTKKA